MHARPPAPDPRSLARLARSLLVAAAGVLLLWLYLALSPGCGNYAHQVQSDATQIAERCTREALVAVGSCSARVVREEICRTARAQGRPEPAYCAKYLPGPLAPASQP